MLDSSVGSVNILASADRTGLTPVLVSPDGTETRMAGDKQDSAEVGGVTIAYDFPLVIGGRRCPDDQLTGGAVAWRVGAGVHRPRLRFRGKRPSRRYTFVVI